MSACPITPLLELQPAAVACPYPYFDQLRDEAPVAWIEQLGCFAVTRHADALEVLRNPELFSSRAPTGPKAMGDTMVLLQELFQEREDLHSVLIEGAMAGQLAVLLTADPPVHDRQRALVSRAFTPRRVRLLEPRIRAIAEGLVDQFIERKRCEFISEFAVGLPLTVIAEGLGIPDGDMAAFKQWSDDFVVAIGNHRLTKDRLAEMLKSQVAFGHYFTERIEERRLDPRDDLISDVVHARIDGTEPLTTPEMLGMFSQFLVAGNETTTKLLGSALLLLLRQPDLLARVRADRTLIPGMVEEALRLESPVQGLFRVANQSTELGGVPIPAGSSIWVVYAAANRDGGLFVDPSVADPDREEKGHLAFGHGIHFCLGAALSRTEARIAFETLFDRLGDIRLAEDNQLEYEESYALHGLKELWIEFDPV
jgi:cytochrome P450